MTEQEQAALGDGQRDAQPSRRRFLSYLGSAAAGAAIAGPATAAVLHGRGGGEAPAQPALPMRQISPFGAHQPGVSSPTPRVVDLVALDLRPDTDKEALGRLMRLWTGDVVALTSGRPAPGDTAAEMVTGNSDLTVTVGWGPNVFRLPGLQTARPDGLGEIPPMRHDRLEDRWSHGDLVLVVGAHDGTTVAHAVRRLVSDAAPFATLRWRQPGFWNGYDGQGRPVTGRNLFGQVDGTGNPRPGTRLFEETVWSRDPGWFAGGTTLVVRRIRMDLDRWDQLTRGQQEQALGRDQRTGAPLSGGTVADAVDLSAMRAGRRAIAVDAHVRLAHPSQNFGVRIFRKGLNYTHDAPAATGPKSESGLLFCSFQSDVERQFVTVQRRLDAGDALNTWTTATGSAVFAVLPGFGGDGWLGDRVLS